MKNTPFIQRALFDARTWLCQCLVLGCVVLSSEVAFGQITLNGDFDHGGLDEFNSFVSGNVVTLEGRDNFNSGDWKWLYFSADNVTGQKPTFRIADNFVGGGNRLDEHQMVYSYDQENWQFFDNNARFAEFDTFVFSNDAPFTQNQVYVAYGLPYSYGRVTSHTTQLATSPWVTPTSSSNASLVIGQSPGGLDDLGRVVAPQDIYGYKITDASATGPKVKIAIISGVHANETLGNYTLEGLVDFLLGNDAEAASLRQRAEFFIYPMANPDGRLAGYNRSTVEQVNDDPNRFWDSPNYGGLSDIKVVGDALLADTGGDVDYFIDFHSTVSGKEGHFGFVHPDFQADPFWQNVLSLEPEVSTRNASLVDLTAQKFGRDELDAEFTMTFETQFIGGENVNRFHELGRNIGLALEQGAHVRADLNFDNVLDSQDWLLFIASAEADLSHLTLIEAYQAGDLDGDGVNSLSDFALFKEAFVEANGLSAFEALFTPVPEPSTIVAAVTVFTVFTGRSRVA